MEGGDGVLFGPKDFPVFKKEIRSDTSRGTEGAVKKNFQFCYLQSPRVIYYILV